MRPRRWLMPWGLFIVASSGALAVTGSIMSSNARGQAAFHAPLDRREALRRAICSTATLLSTTIVGKSSFAAEEKMIDFKSSPGLQAPFAAYSITPDASPVLDPSLTSFSSLDFLQKVALLGQSDSSDNTIGAGAVWLGEHHNSMRDHQLQADIIRSAYELRRQWFSKPNMAIGLEMVQVQYQPVLDAFVNGRISETQMLTQVNWKTQWQWPFDNYRPVFESAKKLKIPLIALNVNSEDLAKVEKGGFPELPNDRLKAYIRDPNGFAAFVEPEAFKTYNDYVIRPSYKMHKDMGLLKYTISGQELDQEMPFRNFFSGRILWDEAMASRAYQWSMDNPNGLIIGLVGADHVKFGNGIPGRYGRLAKSNTPRDNVSVILNPTLIDTRPPGSVGTLENAASIDNPSAITLQLRYLKEGVDRSLPIARAPESTGGVLPLADYIVVG